MMPKVTSVEFPPHRLSALLSNAVARENEEWRKRLIDQPKDKANDISPSDRDYSAAWLAQLTTQFKFSPETFFLAIFTLDRFITEVKVRPRYLKCVALTCFYIASKFVEEEELVPGTRELIENSDCGCRVQDVIRMERIVLTKLQWNIYVTTPLEYLEILHTMAYTQQLKSKTTVKSRSRNLCRVTLELQQVMCHYHICVHPSATIALALLSLDLELISDNSTHWVATTSQLQALLKVSTGALMRCREEISSLLPHKELSPILQNRVYLIKTGAGGEEWKKSTQAVAKKRKFPSSSVMDISNSIKKLHTNDALVSRDDLVTPPPNLVQPTATAEGDQSNDNISGTVPSLADNPGTLTVKPQNTIQDVTPDGAKDPHLKDDCDSITVSKTDVAKVSKSQDDDALSNIRPSEDSSLGVSNESSAIDLNTSGLSDDDDDGHDSDATMTASEGEEEEENAKRNDRFVRRLRPLTYAEIVKCGILTSQSTDIAMVTLNVISTTPEACC